MKNLIDILAFLLLLVCRSLARPNVVNPDYPYTISTLVIKGDFDRFEGRRLAPYHVGSSSEALEATRDEKRALQMTYNISNGELTGKRRHDDFSIYRAGFYIPAFPPPKPFPYTYHYVGLQLGTPPGPETRGWYHPPDLDPIVLSHKRQPGNFLNFAVCYVPGARVPGVSQQPFYQLLYRNTTDKPNYEDCADVILLSTLA